MKKKIFLLLCFLGLVGCSNTPKTSEERVKELTGKEYLKKYGETLSLSEAIEIAKERNLDLKIKGLEREIARLDKNIAFGNFLPSINVVGGYTRLNEGINANVDISSLANKANSLMGALVKSNPEFGALLRSEGIGSLPSSVSPRIVEKSFYNYGVAAQMPIFVPSTWYLYAARKKGEKISELVENLATKMIEIQTMGEYYYIQALESENKILVNEVKSAKELERKAKISLRVEAVLPWEYEKAQVFRKSKELALKENERDLMIAKMNFLKSLNLNPMTEIKLEEVSLTNAKLPSMEECVYEAISSNEMLQISELGKAVSKDVKKIAITNFLPKIILGGGYMYNSNEMLADPSFLTGNISGMLSIFNGFKNVNEYKKSVRREKIQGMKLEKEFLTVVIETTRAYQNFENAKELRNIATLNLKAAEGELHQRKAEKKVEMIGETEYYSALAEYDNALSMKKKADFNYEMALGSLKIAMGKDPFKGEK